MIIMKKERYNSYYLSLDIQACSGVLVSKEEREGGGRELKRRELWLDSRGN